MSYVVNIAITDTFVLRDNANAALTGKVAADFATLEAYALPGGSPTASVTLTEIGSGEYAATFTPTTAATWTVHIVYDSGGVFREFSQTYAVAASGVTAGIAATSGTTLKNLRRLVGQGLGDCVICVATDAGNDQTFYDDEHLDGPDNAYKGFDLYFTGGTVANLAQRRRLTASTQGTGLVTWNRPLPSATAEGDEAELWNTRGIGIKPTEVNDAINAAITFAAAQVTIPVEAEVADAFDRDSPTLVIPAAITRGIYAVVWEDDEGLIEEVDPANGYGREGWFYDRSSQRVIIGGSYLSHMDGQTVTIKGVGRPALLSADTDTTSINAEWLVAEATRRVVTAARLRNPDYERYLPPHWQESQQKRELPSGRGIPNLVMIG